jgi:FtsH-binding integral membrane protein
MKRPHLLILGAWLLQATAWFAPVVRFNEVSVSVPGWEAFLVSSFPLRTNADTYFSNWHSAVLSAVSVVTTVLFVTVSPWLVWRGSSALWRASAWTAAAFFVFNAHCYFLWWKDRSSLRPGYFMWWLSFGLLAIGLFDLAGWSRVNELAKTKTQAAA